MKDGLDVENIPEDFKKSAGTDPDLKENQSESQQLADSLAHTLAAENALVDLARDAHIPEQVSPKPELKPGGVVADSFEHAVDSGKELEESARSDLGGEPNFRYSDEQEDISKSYEEKISLMKETKNVRIKTYEEIIADLDHDEIKRHMEIARQFRVDERSAFRQALYDQGIDWRLDVIDEMLPEGVGFGDSGLSAIIDSQQSDFHVREFTDPDNVKVPVRGERDKYSPLPRVIEEATSEEKAPQNPILHVDDIELTNTNGVAISLKRLLRNNPDANGVKFLHQPDNSFGGNGFNSETQEIRARVPTSLRDLYALFHELGHADDPKGIQYLSRLAEERHFGFEDSELNDKGENIDLVAHVNAERGAWARAYWMLKALRKTGFVNFNEQDLINQAEVSLQTYEDGSFAKERATSSCFYTSAMRKEQRTSGQSQ